jgi:CheY-like chemotaxis protein
MINVSRQKKSPYILIVDDDDDDVFLMRRALTKIGRAAGVPTDWERADNGNEALALLSRRSADERPTAMILDINMPELDGIGVLRALRRSPDLGHLPVFVLTTTATEAAHCIALGLGATRIFVKPNTMGELTGIVREILEAVSGAPAQPVDGPDALCLTTV